MPNPVTVKSLFAAVARRYDLLNHVLSLSIDRIWRRRLVSLSGVTDGARVLDICAGTGDIVIAFLRATRYGHVVGLDFSREMLAVGREKLDAWGRGAGAALVCGDALVLPFADDTFDVATMGFGLRNLADYGRGIEEAARVLRPGGKLLILEFAPPRGGLFALAYRVYLRLLIPIIGGVLTGRREAYEHLSDTIAGFLRPEEVLALMEQARLVNRTAHPQTLGIAYIYIGRK